MIAFIWLSKKQYWEIDYGGQNAETSKEYVKFVLETFTQQC